MRLLIILISTILQFSCRNQMDAKKAAEMYCKCMKEKGFPDRRIYAGTICHAELVEKSRFYKMFFIDKRDENLSKKLTKSTLDSIQLYMRTFVRNLPVTMRETATEVIMSTFILHDNPNLFVQYESLTFKLYEFNLFLLQFKRW